MSIRGRHPRYDQQEAIRRQGAPDTTSRTVEEASVDAAEHVRRFGPSKHRDGMDAYYGDLLSDYDD